MARHQRRRGCGSSAGRRGGIGGVADVEVDCRSRGPRSSYGWSSPNGTLHEPPAGTAAGGARRSATSLPHVPSARALPPGACALVQHRKPTHVPVGARRLPPRGIERRGLVKAAAWLFPVSGILCWPNAPKGLCSFAAGPRAGSGKAVINPQPHTCQGGRGLGGPSRWTIGGGSHGRTCPFPQLGREEGTLRLLQLFSLRRAAPGFAAAW